MPLDLVRIRTLAGWCLGTAVVAITLLGAAAVARPDTEGAPSAAAGRLESPQATTPHERVEDLPAPGSAPAPSTTGEIAPRAAAVTAVEGWQLVIRRIGVNAPISEMGVTAGGQMEVPQNARGIAWYRFTAPPGSAGNAVLAGHVDWAGETGVFGSLRSLTNGDVIDVVAPRGVLTYRVASVTLVRPEEADLTEIVGQRSGNETLTLITCGGDWNRVTRDYDRRVVVRAERLIDLRG